MAAPSFCRRYIFCSQAFFLDYRTKSSHEDPEQENSVDVLEHTHPMFFQRRCHTSRLVLEGAVV